MAKPTRLDYCQYLLSSPINLGVTQLAQAYKEVLPSKHAPRL